MVNFYVFFHSSVTVKNKRIPIGPCTRYKKIEVTQFTDHCAYVYITAIKR